MATNPPTTPQRSDPIREQFFKPLERIDAVSGLLFWVAAILSFATLFIDQKTEPIWYNRVQIAFIIIAVTLFIIGQGVKLYYWPRSETPRRQDFLSNCLGTNLTHIRTNFYYNNNETDPIRRTGAAVIENTLFTSTVVRKMLWSARAFTFLYFLGWITTIAVRDTDLGLVAVAAQALFSEQLLSRWLRMEWLRSKSETIHNNLLSLFRSSPTPTALQPHVWAAFSEYESAKTNAGILTSQSIFDDINPALTAEWEDVKRSANIA